MYHNNLEIIYQRNKKRIKNPPNKDIKRPEYWDIDKKFNRKSNMWFKIQPQSLKLHPRLFIAEFDFSDFFWNINHEYLFNQFDQNGFIINEYERTLIKAFVRVNERGIPQGTSISLFLANLVCWKLDRAFESEGLRFARYADDTVIWSNDYT